MRVSREVNVTQDQPSRKKTEMLLAQARFVPFERTFFHAKHMDTAAVLCVYIHSDRSL